MEASRGIVLDINGMSAGVVRQVGDGRPGEPPAKTP
jgi:hypothetical protein